MSIETLNTAARAAGFAMASPDDAPEESGPDAKPETEAWQAADPMLLAQAAQFDVPKATPASDWVKTLFGVLGRRAPA